MKKSLVILLCGIMLLGIFAGCAAGEQEEGNSSATEQESDWISPELTVTDEFSGQTLNIIANRQMDVGSDEASSDPLEDAIYRMTGKTAETYIL